MRIVNRAYGLDILRKTIVFNFIFIIMINPIVSTFLVFDNNTYDWVESLDKETSEEKEINTDFEDKNIKYNYFTQVLFYSKISKLNLYFKLENIFHFGLKTQTDHITKIMA